MPAKLFARLNRRASPRRPTVMLSLEALEPREVPHSFWWIGGAPFTPEAATAPGNWTTDKPVPPPYPPGSKMYTPGPADDVFFGGKYTAVANCDMTMSGVS